MKSISNYTKASLFLEDITDPTITVKREQGFTVQRFDYECSRKRNTFGLPYGPSLMTTLCLTIKSLPDGHLKSLYKRMAENDPAPFSIVFNATFNRDEERGNVLSDYDNALVVMGTVLTINEIYGDTPLTAGDSIDEGASPNELMMTNVEVLLQSIQYIGSSNYRKELYVNY